MHLPLLSQKFVYAKLLTIYLKTSNAYFVIQKGLDSIRRTTYDPYTHEKHTKVSHLTQNKHAKEYTAVHGIITLIYNYTHFHTQTTVHFEFLSEL